MGDTHACLAETEADGSSGIWRDRQHSGLGRCLPLTASARGWFYFSFKSVLPGMAPPLQPPGPVAPPACTITCSRLDGETALLLPFHPLRRFAVEFI